MASIYELKEQTQGPNGEIFNGTIDGTICRYRPGCTEWIFSQIVRTPNSNEYVMVFCSLDGEVDMTFSGTLYQLQKWFDETMVIAP